jgi:hypothetical protein
MLKKQNYSDLENNLRMYSKLIHLIPERLQYLINKEDHPVNKKDYDGL